jgi:hypothetical protein
MYVWENNESARIKWKQIGGKWKGEKKNEMVKGGDGKTLTTSSISLVWNIQLSWFCPKKNSSILDVNIFLKLVWDYLKSFTT